MMGGVVVGRMEGAFVGGMVDREGVGDWGFGAGREGEGEGKREGEEEGAKEMRRYWW